VYWVEPVLHRPDGLVVVRNITEGAKVKVQEVTEALEPDLLYPLLRGRDVQRWKADPSAWIIVTHLPGMRLNAIPERDMQTRYPRTYGYLKRFEDVLRKRGGWEVKQMMKAGRPFYSMSEIGDYTFAPWKVVWRGQVAPTLVAAVVGQHNGKTVVPDQTVYMLSFNSEEAAHFICSLLNTVIVRFHYLMHGYKHVSMHFVQQINLPSYDPSNDLHKRLVHLSQRAHELSSPAYNGVQDSQVELQQLEAEIDRQAARLWGLSDAELREIQRSLAELEGEEPS
jgi:hypothetical protein